MAIKLGDFFPKKTIDEPALSLNDPRWAGLEGGYHGSVYDASVVLKKLEQTDDQQTINDLYLELWNELYHQGDVGVASYYAVPHLVRIALEKRIVNYNILGLVSIIEIQRHKNNPQLPKALKPNYITAIANLADLAKLAMKQEYWDLDLASTALTAIALAKGQTKLANAINNMDSDDVIDEFLEAH